MSEAKIRAFWDANPCGETYVGGLKEDYETFFDEYDRYRYELEPILPELDRLGLDGLKVLEIGLGQGADSEQLIRRGAQWTGIDLTPESGRRVRKRMEVRGLEFDDIVVGSALEMPFEDNSFDLIYSFGVLHHIPDVKRLQQEIHRVLRPGGRLVMMMYARNSLNYQLSIRVVRRLGLLAALLTGSKDPKVARHVELAREQGPLKYLRMKNFIHRNTDGPDNPYAKVYDVAAIQADFPLFTLKDSFKRFMHAPPLPVHKLPGGSLLGWHLWAIMTPNK
ncbi:MAG: SAM-dependent methyltransferase [Myxococcota bacterium]